MSQNLSSSVLLNAGGAAASAGIEFQKQLGAFFCAWLLSGKSLGEQLNLGGASLVSLCFETEAPVDDILMATSEDGYVAIQAKTMVSLSKKSNSEFTKTIFQFVQHWLICRDGNGGRGWDRPLNPDQDRLVLAVSKDAPKTIYKYLPEALRHRSQPGGDTVLNKKQKHALNVFDSCVSRAWKSLTDEKLEPDLLDQLAQLVVVYMFDAEGTGRSLMQAILETALPERTNAASAVNALEVICGQLMAQRGCVNHMGLRRELMTKGVTLNASPHYKRDIKTLRKHTLSVANSLQRHEEIETEHGKPISIVRECQAQVMTAVLEGSLLIIGEPGVGKSAVMNTLAQDLLSQGQDVLELAVDRHSVESLEGLGKELGLTHSLVEVLEAWDGDGQGWLIIDALDATRGGISQSVFHTLIQQVFERCERWHVVASIRTFDLRMGQQFRSLFKGSPPTTDLREAVFSDVRHIKIAPWSESELQKLLDQAPKFSAALVSAPQRLRDLATVPFNTQLLSELIYSEIDIVDLRQVSSQANLLRLYWQYRVEQHGTPAQSCLHHIVGTMVNTRMLQIPKLEAASQNPELIDKLSQEGVLTTIENDRSIQFRHHLLFDYAAARTFLEPSNIISGEQSFPKEHAHGLMLSPALVFVLREIWELQTDRAQFWTAIGHILGDKNSDPNNP